MANVGTITPSQISVKRKPLHQQQESTTSPVPPSSEIMSTIEDMIAETNFNNQEQVDALSSNLTTIIGESNPNSLTFPLVSATSSPIAIRSAVPSIIPELSVEGFGTPDPSLSASQLGGDLPISNIPLNPLGQQFQELGIPSKPLQIQTPEVDSAVTSAVTPTVAPQQNIFGDDFVDDPFEDAGGKPFDLSGTDPAQVSKQVNALGLVTGIGTRTIPPLGNQNVGDVIRGTFESKLKQASTAGMYGGYNAYKHVEKILESGTKHPMAMASAAGAAIHVVDTAERVYQKAARADGITGFLTDVKNDITESLEGLWGLATDPLTTIQAKANQQIWGAYSPDITNVNLAHGRLAYVQDERGELTHPGALDTVIGMVPFVGNAYKVWNWGLNKTDFKKNLLKNYEDFADATATPDHYINDNMSTYSSGKNNYVNFTERLIGDTDIGQFNGTINLNALVGKNVNDLVWSDIASASVDHLFVDQESDRQQIVNAVKNKLGTLEGVSSVVQGSDVHPGGEITGDITSIANYVRDIHGPAREKHWETFKTQYDYIMSQGIEPGTLIGRGDIFGTTGKWDEDKKEWVEGLKPSDLLGVHDKYGRVNQGKIIRDFYNKTVSQSVFNDENLTSEDYIDFTGGALKDRVDSFHKSIVQESQFTYQNRDLFSIRNQIARAAQNITGERYGLGKFADTKDKDFAAAVLQWGFDTGAKPTEEDLKYLSEYVYMDGKNWGTETPLMFKRGDVTATTATGEEAAPPTKKINVEEETAKLMKRKIAAVREAQASDKPAEGLPPTKKDPILQTGGDAGETEGSALMLKYPHEDLNFPRQPAPWEIDAAKVGPYDARDRRLVVEDLYTRGLLPAGSEMQLTTEPTGDIAPIAGVTREELLSPEGQSVNEKGEAVWTGRDPLPSWFSDDPQLKDDPGFDDSVVLSDFTGPPQGSAPEIQRGSKLESTVQRENLLPPTATRDPFALTPRNKVQPVSTETERIVAEAKEQEGLGLSSGQKLKSIEAGEKQLQNLWLDREEEFKGEILERYTTYDTAEADKKFIDGVVKSTTEGKKEAKRNNDPKTAEILDYLEKEAWENIDESSKAAAERLDGPKPEDKYENFTWNARDQDFTWGAGTVEKAAVQRDAEITVSPSDFTGFGVKEERDLIAQHAGEPVLNPTFKDAVDKKGVNVEIPEGGNVTAAVDGKIVASVPSRGFGHLIIVESPDGVHTLYGGIKPGEKKEGDRLFAGDIVGTVVRSNLEEGSVYIEQRKDGEVTSDSKKALINAINSGKHISVGGSDRSQAKTPFELVTDPARLKAFQEEPPAPPPPAPLPVFRPPQRQPVYSSDPITDYPDYGVSEVDSGGWW